MLFNAMNLRFSIAIQIMAQEVNKIPIFVLKFHPKNTNL